MEKPSLLENERILGMYEARSGKPIPTIQEDSKEYQQRRRLHIPHINNTSFYYDTFLHKEHSTKPIDEGEYSLTTIPITQILLICKA